MFAKKAPKALNINNFGAFPGGSWRIRTAVNGFADRCLATRPRNHSLQMVDHYIIASLSRIASAK